MSNIINEKRDIAREQERLNSPVRLDLEGEDPAVKALKQLPEASNLDALEIALALQQLIRGNASILENQKEQADELNRLKAEMAKMDESARRWETDRQAWLDEVNRKADAIRPSEAEKEKIEARESTRIQKAVDKARAEFVVEKQMFDQKLAAEEKVTVTSPGEFLLARVGGGPPQPRLYPEVIKIKHREWILQPGVPTEVPKTVAEFMRLKRKQQQELAARQDALSPDPRIGKYKEYDLVDQRMREIDKQFGSSSDHLQ